MLPPCHRCSDLTRTEDMNSHPHHAHAPPAAWLQAHRPQQRTERHTCTPRNALSTVLPPTPWATRPRARARFARRPPARPRACAARALHLRITMCAGQSITNLPPDCHKHGHCNISQGLSDGRMPRRERRFQAAMPQQHGITCYLSEHKTMQPRPDSQLRAHGVEL